MMRKIPRNRFAATLVVVTTLLNACGSREPPTNAPAPTPETTAQSTPVSSPLTGFAKDLQYVKNGRFSHIWVFSRKDGKPLDKDDSAFLRTNAPQVVDWVITDEGKKVIGGTNFNLEEGNLGQLEETLQCRGLHGEID